MSRGKAIVNLWDSATAVASTNSITSKAVSQGKATGIASLLVILAGSGPSVNITFTVGRTATDTFYSPIDIDGTSLNEIYTALTSTSWIQFTPVIAPYTKIVITGDGSNSANTTARAYLIFEEDL